MKPSAARPDQAFWQDAQDGVCEVQTIAEILRALASADISGARTIEGVSVDYLAKQLAAAADRVDGAIEGMMRRAGTRERAG